MGIPCLILGDSGAGKTSSLRNIDPEKAALIQCIKKPLPFKSGKDWKNWDHKQKTGSIIYTDSSQTICRAIGSLPRYGKEVIIIDDFQYVMANEFMRRVLDHETGNQAFAKYNEIAKQAWDICMAAQMAEGNTRVYLLSHTQQDDFGNVKIKTIGKLLDEKIVIEGLFSIVMRAMIIDGNHVFSTKSNGNDTVKTPMEMFDDTQIDNDLSKVDEIIKSYHQ